MCLLILTLSGKMCKLMETPQLAQKRECIATPDCQARCLALARLGLAQAGIGEPGVCGVPQLLTQHETHMSVRGLEGNYLANKLATGLASEIDEYTADTAERERILAAKAGFKRIFDAHGMLYAEQLQAVRDGRVFTPEELEYHQEMIHDAHEAQDTLAKDAEMNELLLAQAAFDRDTMDEHGIVFTTEMQATIEHLIECVTIGKPALILGDKGISKTGAAKYVSRLVAPGEVPLIISGHADLMSHELTGSMAQDESYKDGIRLQFKYGKIAQGSNDGKPVLLDEVNFSEQGVMARLNDFMLLRPGDTFELQENGGRKITIMPGFALTMTANVGDRYLGRNQLDAAFRDRADIIKLAYPDATKEPLKSAMPSTLRLALAAAVDTNGRLSPHIEMDDLMHLAQLSHVSQQLYSQPATSLRNIKNGCSTATSVLDTEPVMSECITPRTMMEVIARCREGNIAGGTLPTMIERLLDSLDDTGDANKKILILNVAKPTPAK